MKHLDNEKKILYFNRVALSSEVQLASVKLRPGESSLFHYHTQTKDTFYVINGSLAITLLVDLEKNTPAYHQLGLGAVQIVNDLKPIPKGRRWEKHLLSQGETFVIQPNIVHCAANESDKVCEFLCIEGVGIYDFIEVKIER